MATSMTHMVTSVWGISVFITPVARPRTASGAVWERFPGSPAPARWREKPSLRGFHGY